MTRLKDPLAAEKEAHLQLAIAAVLNKQHTCHSAAIAFNIPRRTLYNRVNGNMKPRNQAHENEQNLIHAEEKELVQWITRLTISGYAPRYETLRKLAEIIRERRFKKKRRRRRESSNRSPRSIRQGLGSTLPTTTSRVSKCPSTKY